MQKIACDLDNSLLDIRLVNRTIIVIYSKIFLWGVELFELFFP
jgi:hypothetical protein